MKMRPDQIAMLVCGVLLFLAALGCLVAGRSAKLVTSLFLFAILMIGFPSIKSFKVMGAEFELNRSLAAVEKDPTDVAARNKLATQVAQLSKQTNLTAETRVTLAKAQFVLGQDKEAATNLRSALKEKPNLPVDPKLRAAVGPNPH
jgi:hypothetical protein